MSLEEDVEQLLDAWDHRLRNIDENLLALEGEPTYQMLAGGARATLEGITRERVGPALDALSDLFEHRERLSEVLEKARALQKDAGFWDKGDKYREIMTLLHGRSIKLGTKTTPLAQRHLLDPAASEVAIVPDELLGAMAHAYEVARDAVGAVAAAWARLEPRLEQAEREVGALEKQASGLGEAAIAEVHGELGWLLAELQRVRALVANDPLGVTGSFDTGLAPRLEMVRATLSGLTAQRTRVASGLSDAEALLVRITTTHAEAEQAERRAPSEVSRAIPASASSDEVLGLGPWREKIAATTKAGRFRSADVGLTRWFDAARALLMQDRAVCKALADALEQRDELGGRLSSRRAQLAALEARGTRADTHVPDLAVKAARLLAHRPTDLDQAKHAVDAYEAAVVELSGQAHGR